MRVVTLATATALAALAVAPAAAADSIVFERDGEVWAAEPDGSGQARISNGGFVRPAQSDDGTIVAVKDDLLQRMTRTGQVLNAAGSSEAGPPLHPSFRPDGTLIAYNAFSQGPGSPGFRTRISYADRPTAPTEIFSITGWSNPSWIGNDVVLMFKAGSSIADTLLWRVGESGTTEWFDDTSAALGGGEVDPAVTKLAAAADGGATIRLYRLPAPPPAQPEPRCTISGPVGSFFRPTWSPDGTALAWQEDDGIHVGRYDLESCAGSQTLVIPGGRAPDWGPAPPPSSGGPPSVVEDTTAPTVTVVAPRRARRARARRGLTVRAGCDEPCRVIAELRTVSGRLVARRARDVSTGTARLRLRPRAVGRRRLRGARSVSLVVLATDRVGNAAAPVRRAIRLV